jgi:hypothetical protein
MENQLVSEAELLALGSTPLAKPKKMRLVSKTKFNQKLVFPAIPVRGLWDRANQEERVQAQKIAMTMLQAWTGIMTKSEAAKTLGLRPVRFWQMSNQAMSGMMAGCLTQPRNRRKVNYMGKTDQELIKELTKEVSDLKKQIQCQHQLIEAMKSMPGIEEALNAKSKEGLHARVQKKGRRNAAGKAMDNTDNNSEVSGSNTKDNE